VKKAVSALPAYFESETHIEGISATDIFTLNSALGATIEEQVVAALNRNRSAWDPDGSYCLYAFVRQPQTFPDVVLRRTGEDADIIMGVELKGWYILSKEGEPSFRYTVTPAACAPADLLVVVPWALKNVLSGPPRAFAPYVISARHAAKLRNYYWMHQRSARGDKGVIPPGGEVGPYPNKANRISDSPAYDGGGNFGRYARTGIMDAYLEAALALPLCGIPARAWLDFFKVFTESSAGQDVRERIEGIRQRIADAAIHEDRAEMDAFRRILEIIEGAI
jgi:hypothetical protein